MWRSYWNEHGAFECQENTSVDYAIGVLEPVTTTVSPSKRHSSRLWDGGRRYVEFHETFESILHAPINKTQPPEISP
jgi:hypothetical protein